jgi:DNA-binding XRE family transcriptional regulator
MQSLPIKNILRLLSLLPVQISRVRRPYPRHWKLKQQIPQQPCTLGGHIKQRRLALHWLQSDVAAKIGTSATSVSNWERGITTPSRMMTKKIQAFLSSTPSPPIMHKRSVGLPCPTCGISENSSEQCLFEKVCGKPH